MAAEPTGAWLLGSGGWIPSGRRETCCALVRRGPHALLLDAGTGARRLVTDPELLAGVEQLDVVLTHFHLDHVVGLAYLPALAHVPERRLWGPGRLLYGASTQAICERLVAAPFFGAPLEACVDEAADVPSGDVRAGPWTLAHRTQRRHSDPVLGLRLGDDLAYCTDTAADPETAGFAQGVATLAHDAWSTSGAPEAQDIHATAREAAEVAAAAGARRLLLIHVHPFGDDEALLADAAAVVDTRLGEDLAEVLP